MNDYQAFLKNKQQQAKASGFEVDPAAINSKLFLFQRDIVRWALKLGKAAIFAECGLGKTPMQLEWAKQVVNHTGGKVLILAPLAVAHQTIREGKKFDVKVDYVGSHFEVGDSEIVITNYERLGKFDAEAFAGIVLDESSILKAFTGSTKRHIIEAFRKTPYKLACTATPAPNDYLELGNHADFLDIMPSNEMISRWFINNTMQAGDYRLKNHARADFWRWLTSWAVCISEPADLGPQYDMPGFNLPPLNILEHLLATPQESIERSWAEGRLIPDDHPSSTTMHQVKRESLTDRVQKAVEIVNDLDEGEPVIIWCDTNYEADALMEAFPTAVEVRGSQTQQRKELYLNAFTDGEARIIITKPDIAGFGLNWQHCAEMVFVGVSYSFEKTYQALRRSYRFGQTKPVNAHLIYAATEGNIMTTLNEKQGAFKDMQQEMNTAMHEHGLFRDDKKLALVAPETERESGRDWTLYLGDCVEVTKQLPDNSVDFGIHSPPFSNLYIYSDSEADMGNNASDDEFFDHYEFLIEQLYRITRPGRLCAVHCKDLPLYKNRDDAMGLRDFPGEIIRRFEKHGWVFHSRVTIWKDPVVEMERTRNHGLLHKNFAQRAEGVRQGMADYLIVLRKWPVEDGANVTQIREPGDYVGTDAPAPAEYLQAKRQRVPDFYPATVEQYNYSIAVWQRYASPVWWDIDQTNVLNYKLAKDGDDEKHIAPLQLDVIERSIDLWTNPGEVVFSPFAGVGSEGVGALRRGRKFIGIELKHSYFDAACRFLKEAEQEKDQLDFNHLLG